MDRCPLLDAGREVIFYAVICLVLLAPKAGGGGKYLPIVALLISIWSAAYWSIYLLELRQVQVPFHRLLLSGKTKQLLTQFGCFFALGMSLWQFSERRKIGLAFVSAVIALPTCIIALSHADTGASKADFYTVIIFVLALVALAESVLRESPRIGERVGSILRDLGLATYPLYLIHFAPGLILMRGLVLADFPPTSRSSSPCAP